MNNARRNDSATKVINTTNDAAGSVAVTDKGEVFTQVTTLNPGTAATSSVRRRIQHMLVVMLGL